MKSEPPADIVGIRTLIETAKMNGHNPRAWLTRVLDAIGRERDAVDLDALMPWTMATDPA